MTQAFENQSAQAMLKMFGNVIDHGTAASAEALFGDLKQSSQQTRADVYSLLEARALEQAGKDIAAWNDFQWQLSPALDVTEYSQQRRAILNELTRLKPLAQIFYRLSQHATKDTNAWIRNFGEEFSIMTPENKNSPEALADSFAATRRLPAPKSALAAAHAEAADKAKTSYDVAEQNHQQLREISKKRHINTGMKP